jgi:hypothetical protein
MMKQRRVKKGFNFPYSRFQNVLLNTVHFPASYIYSIRLIQFNSFIFLHKQVKIISQNNDKITSMEKKGIQN